MSTTGNSTLEKLIAGCAKGDRECQRKLYELFYSKMMGVCIRYASNHEDAKDLLHDGFLKVFSHIKKFSHAGSFEGWVRRIMINTVIDNFRKNRNIFLKDANDLQNLQNEEPDLDVLGQLSTEDVLKAVQQLSPAYRAVFNLYVIEGFSHKEIAKELSISIGTSKSNLMKARNNLKKIVPQVTNIETNY